MPAKTFGDQVLEAVGRSRDAMAAAMDLPTARLPLFDFTELLFELGKTVGAQGAGVVDVPKLSRGSWPRTAENRRRLALFGPNGEPHRPAVGALAQFFPLGDIDRLPAHDLIIFDHRPVESFAARAASRRRGLARHGVEGTRKLQE